MVAPIVAAGAGAVGSAVSNRQAQPQITISNGNSSGGIPWYGWLLIAIVILAGIFFIAPFVIEKIGSLLGIAKEGIWNAALATPLGGILGFFFPSKGSNSNSYSARQGAKGRTVASGASSALISSNPILRFSFLRFLR